MIDNSFLGKIPKERILVTFEPEGQGHQRNKGWSKDISLYMSDVFFNGSSTLLVERGNKFLLTNEPFWTRRRGSSSYK